MVGLLIRKIKELNDFLRNFYVQVNESKKLEAKLLIELNNAKKNISSFSEIEFSVNSQYGDDGIIQYLINKYNITNKIFIEFGVENYREANTRFLLENNNWSGLIIDGSEKNIDFIKKEEYFYKYDLTATCSFVTAENINELITSAGISGRIGILHIDIDGNDYWIWNAINVVDPDIVIMEYNSCFGIERSITIPYQPEFYVRNAHYSGIYFGASLRSLYNLAEEKGYYFVGSNSNGNNAYFVKKDLKGDLKILTPEEGYVKSKFRQNRDKSGKLTFKSDHEVIKTLENLKVFNTITGQLEPLN